MDEEYKKGYYKGIKVTEENEDELCGQKMDEEDEEFKKKLDDVDIIISDSKGYLFESNVLLIEEVKKYVEDGLIYSTEMHLKCIQSNLELLDRHASTTRALSHVTKMLSLINSPMPEVVEDE